MHNLLYEIINSKYQVFNLRAIEILRLGIVTQVYLFTSLNTRVDRFSR